MEALALEEIHENYTVGVLVCGGSGAGVVVGDGCAGYV
jgi:hypothetical protein